MAWHGEEPERAGAAQPGEEKALERPDSGLSVCKWRLCWAVGSAGCNNMLSWVADGFELRVDSVCKIPRCLNL